MLHLTVMLVTLVQLPLPDAPVDALVWQDFDRDGREDLLVVPGSGALRLLRNRGDGTFEHLTRAFGRGAPVARQAVWGDLDGDGWSDLATLGPRGELRLFTNLAGDHLEELPVGLEVRSVQGASALRLLDFDGDRALDLTLDGPGGARLLRNAGGAHFVAVELGGAGPAPLAPAPSRESAPEAARTAPPSTGSTTTGSTVLAALPPPPTVSSATAIPVGIPPGYMILGDTPTAPAGYTATGLVVKQERWIDRAAMTPRVQHGAAAVGNTIYVCGGSGSTLLSSVEGYDISTHSWTSLSPMSVARFSLGAAAVGTKVYAVGGGDATSVLGLVEEYDTTTDTWSVKAPLGVARLGCAVVAVAGKVYALGGMDASFTYIASVEEYDPSTNTWTPKAPVPSARIDASAATISGKIYLVGGYNGAPLADLHVFDPATDTWTTKAPPFQGRYGHATAFLGNQLFVVGGPGATHIERYDPGIDTWVRVIPHPIIQGLSVVNAGGRLFALGGATGMPMNLTQEFDPVVLYAFEKN